jgi:hypothetical protein
MWGSHLGNDDANDFERVTQKLLSDDRASRAR